MASELPNIARRLASMLYEGLVIFSILLIGFLLPQIVFYAFGMVQSGRMLMLHILILLMVYFVWCWLNGGQTLPMKTWKLRIANPDGSPLRPAQAILRYLAAWPSILLGGIGLFWAAFDPDKQFLHDRIAGSRIISQASPEI
jgi:uncharacterized RDD family membrane protein YckC